jgi:hypothetical protein
MLYCVLLISMDARCSLRMLACCFVAATYLRRNRLLAPLNQDHGRHKKRV